MHDALAMTHNHSKAQARMFQLTQHLNTLDQLTTDLYTTHIITLPRPPQETLIPRLLTARHLINKVCASWILGIEQLMRTSKLVTTHKPRQQRIRSGKHTRKGKITLHPAQGDDNATYLDTFNNINSALARHGLLGATLKQSTPTIDTINRPYIALFNSIVHTFIDKHANIRIDISSLEHQHQEAHDTRLIQNEEYRLHHTTPDAGIHAPTKTMSTEKDFIAPITATSQLVAMIHLLHNHVSAFTKYDTWSPTVLPSPVFLKLDTPTDIYRKHANLSQANWSAIKILCQIKRQLINIIGRRRTDTINHDINISQLRRAYKAARPRILSAPPAMYYSHAPSKPNGGPNHYPGYDNPRTGSGDKRYIRSLNDTTSR